MQTQASSSTSVQETTLRSDLAKALQQQILHLEDMQRRKLAELKKLTKDPVNIASIIANES